MRTQLGPYRLGRRLAVGGMAEIFEAQGTTGQPLVVKVLLPQHKSDAELRQMFRDEAALAARLDHPNLVRVVGHGVDGGTEYMVMERVDGVTLWELLRQCPRLTLGVAAHVARSLLAGLEYLHTLRGPQGELLDVVHRDLSPSNVLISQSGAVKLADLGIARSTLRTNRTRTGVIKGTVQYMAPEQVIGDQLDARTDVYGVGLLLFECLCGCPFVRGEREIDLLREAEAPTWRDPSSHCPALGPAGLDDVLRTALQRFPEQRFQSAAAFADRLPVLDGAQADLAKLVSRAASAPRTDDHEQLSSGASEHRDHNGKHQSDKQERRTDIGERRSHRRWTAWLTAGGLAVVATALGIWYVLHRPTEPVVPLASRRADARASGANVVAMADARPARAPDSQVAALDRSAGRVGRVRVVRRRGAERPIVRPKADAGLARTASRIVSIQALRDRLQGVLQSLGRRGVLADDLPPGTRGQLTAVQRALAQGDTSAAETTLVTLQASLTTLRVDRRFVREKLNRVDRAIRAAAGRTDLPALRERAGTALQDFMDGRYVAANEQLNRILGALKK